MPLLVHQMVSNEYQDLKKPELFSSPTVSGLVVLKNLREMQLDQMAERAVDYVKGTSTQWSPLTCVSELLFPFIWGIGRGESHPGTSGWYIV
jgi:hypothetical protein